MNTSSARAQVTKPFQRQSNDVGSPEVQVAWLTHRIAHLTDHCNANKNDKHTTRGLQLLNAKRRRLLNYLKRTKPTLYINLIKQLKLRK